MLQSYSVSSITILELVRFRPVVPQGAFPTDLTPARVGPSLLHSHWCHWVLCTDLLTTFRYLIPPLGLRINKLDTYYFNGTSSNTFQYKYTVRCFLNFEKVPDFPTYSKAIHHLKSIEGRSVLVVIRQQIE